MWHDFSKTRIITKMNTVSNAFWFDTLKALKTLSATDPWVYTEMLNRDMVYLLDIGLGTGENIKDIYNALMYCYSHQSSTMGLYKLFLAIFGNQANIIITSDNPAVLGVEVSNANTLFTSAFVSNVGDWVTKTPTSKGITFNTFRALTTDTDLTRFFEQFATAGTKININIIV